MTVAIEMGINFEIVRGENRTLGALIGYASFMSVLNVSRKAPGEAGLFHAASMHRESRRKCAEVQA